MWRHNRYFPGKELAVKNCFGTWSNMGFRGKKLKAWLQNTYTARKWMGATWAGVAASPTNEEIAYEGGKNR